MRTTIKDIAKMAGVSVSTVSMALNGKKGISAETVEYVKKIAGQLNYVPNANAKTLKNSEKQMVGIIIPDIVNPFFASVVDSLHKVLTAHGFSILVGITGSRNEEEKRYVHEFVGRSVCGIILIPSTNVQHDLTHLYDLKRIGIPLIFLTTKYSGIPADCIMTDLKEGTYHSTRYLLENGYRNIAFLGADSNLEFSFLRLKGYSEALNEFKLQERKQMIFETIPDFAHGYGMTDKIIRQHPDAIITINDFMACGVLRRLKELKISVPEQMAVVGFDDMLYASLMETPLTTVRQPVDKICAKSVEILMSYLNGSTEDPRTITFLSELIIRKTTCKK